MLRIETVAVVAGLTRLGAKPVRRAFRGVDRNGERYACALSALVLDELDGTAPIDKAADSGLDGNYVYGFMDGFDAYAKEPGFNTSGQIGYEDGERVRQELTEIFGYIPTYLEAGI